MQQKQTILLVDDVEYNIDILVELLSEYHLLKATGGKEAIEIAMREDAIDLILLDIMMPEVNGLEVCRFLKQEPKKLHIPIIFLSANNSQEDIKRGFEAGGVDYIAKPFYIDELLSRVKTHLALRAYEKNLEVRVQEEVQKNKIKEQMMYQQSKQAALGELLMHIAHQWKQPLASLSSINNLSKTKLESPDVCDKDEFLKFLIKAGDIIEFMGETIDTFQNFYRPSSNKKSFSLTDAVIEILTIVEGTFYFDDIKIYIISHENENVFGNPNEFSQVIFTLLNNAREILKLRNTINPEIHIAIENQKISVSDNGGGIQGKSFEEIFLSCQLPAHMRDDASVGLYFAKILVEKNGGVITASNSKDGAVFTIEFLTWME
ncbi:response regulator [Sulfurimonas sp.]|uniref:response regulator n=1 Tax=Sulfurimonas sp. TaxID=2022749 RepID=UPI003D0EB7CA